jgi:hypothetical protein
MLLGCWDFAALSTDGGYVPPDLTPPPDIACNKTPNKLVEDCTANNDVNNNCLYGCDDPDCYDHVACFAKKGYMTYGGVNIAGCQGQTKGIYENLMQQANCNGSCSCDNTATTCNGNLNVFPDSGNCTAGTNSLAKVAVQKGPQCQTLTATLQTNFYSLDKLTAGGTCSPAKGTVTLNPVWGTTATLCDQSASGLTRFANMATNGIQCIVFSGTDTTVCAGTKPYTKPTVYYTGFNGTSTCNCACGAPTGGCTIGNKEAELADQLMCKGNLTEIKTFGTGGCVQAVDNNNKPVAAATFSTNLASPTCAAAGTVNGNFTATGPLTFCCM